MIYDPIGLITKLLIEIRRKKKLRVGIREEMTAKEKGRGIIYPSMLLIESCTISRIEDSVLKTSAYRSSCWTYTYASAPRVRRLFTGFSSVKFGCFRA